MTKPDWCPQGLWDNAETLFEDIGFSIGGCGCDDCREKWIPACARALLDARNAALGEWRSMESAPKDGSEVLLLYRDWGGRTLIVSGHWHEQDGREYEATWEHSHGYGDADMWMPLPSEPGSRWGNDHGKQQQP